jgi:hypothetical protein
MNLQLRQIRVVLQRAGRAGAHAAQAQRALVGIDGHAAEGRALGRQRDRFQASGACAIRWSSASSSVLRFSCGDGEARGGRGHGGPARQPAGRRPGRRVAGLRAQQVK